eukprot:462140-Alexandrium_andersonii.AAC.1
MELLQATSMCLLMARSSHLTGLTVPFLAMGCGSRVAREARSSSVSSSSCAKSSARPERGISRPFPRCTARPLGLKPRASLLPPTLPLRLPSGSTTKRRLRATRL